MGKDESILRKLDKTLYEFKEKNSLSKEELIKLLKSVVGYIEKFNTM